ncbi:alpha/beta fold hydrolase [Seongchinamella sediminis]|uniref:Alpha/beta fold hydrolase n=1 Tax=Seongchinamella sediminis TaxID=2283635 RepID=A0A3L7E246_9GAMM|nr:alpha/beta hydrolase [Seongchinamella sediminis]RLQ22975.1 alpha/beta fold hydrolase [Seongchinamella sediminis]
MIPEGAEEHRWQVDGLEIAGLSWGDPAKPPVLALHGWLDNACSFALLAPLLAERYVIALDLTGHGQSSRRSADATYQVYDDLPQIHEVIQQLGWERFTLIGHSRGAIISSLYAAAFPEQVEKLVLLDSISPPPLEPGEFNKQLRRFVLEKHRLTNRRTRVYETRELAITARQEQGLGREAAELIAGRNLKQVDGGYTWTTDPRLRGASAVKMTAEQVDTMLGSLGMPTLLLMAGNGLASTHARRFSALGERIPDVVADTYPGGHHFHMESGVDKLGARINHFLSSGE